MSTLYGLIPTKQSFITKKALSFRVFHFDHQSLTALVLNDTDAVSCIIFLYFSLDRWLENETAIFFLKAWRHCFLDSKNSHEVQVQILGATQQTVVVISELGFTYRPLNVKEDKDIRTNFVT